MDVIQLYDEIYSLFMMKALDGFTESRVSELLTFQDKCQELFKLYNYLRQNPTEEERLCQNCLGEKEETLSEAISRAYHSVLFTEIVPEDNFYFEGMPQDEGLECSESVNPYQDLREVSYFLVKKQDIRIDDIRFVFTKLRELFNSHISDECLLEEFYKIWEPLETTYSKYTRQSLEQH